MSSATTKILGRYAFLLLVVSFKVYSLQKFLQKW